MCYFQTDDGTWVIACDAGIIGEVIRTECGFIVDGIIFPSLRAAAKWLCIGVGVQSC
jgi:hypothetical protein